MEYLRAQQEKKDLKNDLCRDVLKKRRTTLLTEGQLSAELKAALRVIWTWYCESHSGTFDNGISSISAARLWYRSGLKFSRLCKLLDRKRKNRNESDKVFDGSISNAETFEGFQFDPKVEFADFLDEVQNVIDDEEEKISFKRNEGSLEPVVDSNSSISHDSSFRVRFADLLSPVA
jgi:hypothetical protein